MLVAFYAHFPVCLLTSPVPTLSQSTCRDPSVGCLRIIHINLTIIKTFFQEMENIEMCIKDFINTIFFMMKVITITQSQHTDVL